jgi:ABC-2 type transport system ATP-binding protein
MRGQKEIVEGPTGEHHPVALDASERHPSEPHPSEPHPVVHIDGLSKTYDTGFVALSDVNLTIFEGEIFALLGPNGAGKTTLIGITCGLVNPTSGRVLVDGHDVVRDFRAARALVGLVPQELSTDMFETVWDTVAFSRGLFGKPRNDALLERVLRDLSLWEKRQAKIMTLSGGMKRRVLIAKALAHEPRVLFLDEPTAGVDVELRRDMWALVSKLRETGVTIILTTHYIEEAEQMADRVGVINRGRIVLVQEKVELMKSLGKKELILHMQEPLSELPTSLADKKLELSQDGHCLTYTFDTHAESTGIALLLQQLNAAGIVCRDLNTRESSLEDIFVSLVQEEKSPPSLSAVEGNS